MGLISEETIQRVVEANDIVDVIGSYFPLKRAGTTFRALCPFHREKTPSFHVNPARQSFHCFGCNAGGGVLRFVMDYEHVDFPTAVRRMAARAGIPVLEDVGGDAGAGRDVRQRLLALHAEAAEWFHHRLIKSPEGGVARDYLKSRAITSAVAKSWQLGYAPDSWDALLNFLKERKFTSQEIGESGLSSKGDEENDSRAYSRFRHRLMFPIRNDYGEVIAFSGRVLVADAKAAKYVNSPETSLFTKGRVLYGLDKTKRDLIEKKAAIVCEGQIDLISAYEAGVRHVIAPQGTAFTADQARLLKRFVDTVLLCFDSDTAGQAAILRSLPALLSQGLSVKIITLPTGQDPDSLIRSQGAEAFLRTVESAQDFFDHALTASGSLESPTEKSRLVRTLGPLLALVQDATLREGVLGRLASRLGLPHSVIRSSMKPSKSSHDEESQETPVERLTLSAGMEILCHLALVDQDARDWLAEQESASAMEAGGELLDKILGAPFLDGQLSMAWLAALPAIEERAISALALHRTLPDALERAIVTWRGLKARKLTQMSEGLKSRLSQPGITAAEITKIQKQILDLKIQVADVQRPFSEGSAA